MEQRKPDDVRGMYETNVRDEQKSPNFQVKCHKTSKSTTQLANQLKASNFEELYEEQCDQNG